MLKITARLDHHDAAEAELYLPFEIRQKSRFRATLADGTSVGVYLPRGGLLRGGDRLRAEDGRVIAVRAAPEAVSTVAHADPRQLARGAYHLGNRHVQLQLGAGWLRYLQDHVLDGMCRQLGLSVTHEQAAFEPEAGAYGGHHGHRHAHG